jgi:hypothetical protein
VRGVPSTLEAEVDAYLAAHQEWTDERGHRLVRHNGHAQPRQVMTVAGQVELVRPESTIGGSTMPPASGCSFRA